MLDSKSSLSIAISAVFDLIVFSYQGVRMYSKLMPMDKETPSRIIKEIIGGNYCRSFIFENKEAYVYLINL